MILFRLCCDHNYIEFTLKNEHKFALSSAMTDFSILYINAGACLSFCGTISVFHVSESECGTIDDKMQSQSIMTKVCVKMYIVLSDIKDC